MKLAALVLLVAVGMALNEQNSEALTPDQIIKSLMGSRPYWKVMYALDSSGSIDSTEWTQSKSAARDILAIINYIPHPNSIVPSGHKIGLVRFSSTTPTTVIFSLGTYPYYPANDAAIAAVPKVGHLTNMNKALALCERQLGLNGRRLVWMTTDGYYNEGGDPRPRATAMKRTGTVICVVAIGTNPNMAVINAIASWITSFDFDKCVKCVLTYDTYEAYWSATYAAKLRVVVPEAQPALT
ncbi:uncharacterized protein LOC106150911 isoform X2 [Lingula anatina]|uniref:Uncharacterized protein LOC106150911 isoform X2 n=1 Tax=Lingula anatina TaxID=7574 RepID=A0A1S3H1N3_LINAN|nr:uncharacterized protein LOC106150911 isoform X2 [Lingula anatina]|eukprot:XP_013379391.1 uncharacterized protein LOC106150911 isoform X2 [Lingula anatina]